MSWDSVLSTLRSAGYAEWQINRALIQLEHGTKSIPDIFEELESARMPVANFDMELLFAQVERELSKIELRIDSPKSKT